MTKCRSLHFCLSDLTILYWTWGTGMIASSSTFRPHPGRVIRDLFRLLNVAKHCTEALVYSNHPREAAAFSYLAIIFGRIASDVLWSLAPQLNSGANAAPASLEALV